LLSIVVVKEFPKAVIAYRCLSGAYSVDGASTAVKDAAQ
jgi:hypothetical protein